MTWALYMTLGAGVLKAFQVCARGAREMADHDASEESWKSIMRLEENR